MKKSIFGVILLVLIIILSFSISGLSEAGQGAASEKSEAGFEIFNLVLSVIVVIYAVLTIPKLNKLGPMIKKSLYFLVFSTMAFSLLEIVQVLTLYGIFDSGILNELIEAIMVIFLFVAVFYMSKFSKQISEIVGPTKK